MGRLPKNTQISAQQALSKVVTTRSAAKRQAIELLKGCLDSHLLTEDHSNLINDVSKAIGYDESDHLLHFNHSTILTSPSSTRSTTSHKRSFDQFQYSEDQNDDHNEVCEVCDKGGDLLCCETCSLVFHLKCLRPKLAEIPTGSWNCAYCVLDGTVNDDKDAARKSLRSMARLANGDSSETEEENGNKDSSSYRISKVGEITILQSGKKYLVRRKGRKHSTELGRYSTLAEALSTITSVQEAKSFRGDGKVVKKSKQTTEIWCTQCNDDPSVELCAFCGCKVCFGKNQPHLLILCDHCNRETHAFCLHPPLNSVPSDDPWYCETCFEQFPKPSSSSPPPIPAPDDEHDFDLLPLDTDSLSIGHGLDDRERDDKDALSPSFHNRPGQSHDRTKTSEELSPNDHLLDIYPSPDPNRSISLSNEFSAIQSHDHQVLSDESFVFHPSPLLQDIDVHDDDLVAEEPAPDVYLCSLDSVLNIINQLHEYKLTPNDLDALEELRTWGSLQDLHQATLTLSRQRDMLLNRLALISPEVATEFKKKCGLIENLPVANPPPSGQYQISGSQVQSGQHYAQQHFPHQVLPHQQYPQLQHQFHQSSYYPHPSSQPHQLLQASQQSHLHQQQPLHHQQPQQHYPHMMMNLNQYSIPSKPLMASGQPVLGATARDNGGESAQIKHPSSVSNNNEDFSMIHQRFNRTATPDVSTFHPNDQEFLSGLFSNSNSNTNVSSELTGINHDDMNSREISNQSNPNEKR